MIQGKIPAQYALNMDLEFFVSYAQLTLWNVNFLNLIAEMLCQTREPLFTRKLQKSISSANDSTLSTERTFPRSGTPRNSEALQMFRPKKTICQLKTYRLILSWWICWYSYQTLIQIHVVAYKKWHSTVLGNLSSYFLLLRYSDLTLFGYFTCAVETKAPIALYLENYTIPGETKEIMNTSQRSWRFHDALRPTPRILFLNLCFYYQYVFRTWYSETEKVVSNDGPNPTTL